MGQQETNQKALRGKLDLRALLRVDTGLHIGASSDFAPIGAVDSPFLRDPLTKQPIIPGSSLKGKLRTLLARSFAEGYFSTRSRTIERKSAASSARRRRAARAADPLACSSMIFV